MKQVKDMNARSDRARFGHRTSGLACVLAGAALLMSPLPAAAQQADGLDRLERDYPADVIRGVEDVLERAGELGVSRQALADKALEGAAKRVPGDRLLQALERRLDGLRTAADALPADAGPASVRAGADALGQGLDPDDLRGIGELASEADRPAALVVLGELSRLGVPVDQAEASVARALERGDGSGSVMALGQQVRDAVRAGESPLAALQRAGVGPFGSGFPGVGPPGGFPGGGPPGLAGPPVPPGAGPPGGFPGQGPPGDGPPDGPPTGTPGS
jgi:hypothetical protein